MKSNSINFIYNNKFIEIKEFSLKNITLKLLYITIIISLIFKSKIESKKESLIFGPINKNINKFLSISNGNIIKFGNESSFLFKNNNKIDNILSNHSKEERVNPVPKKKYFKFKSLNQLIIQLNRDSIFRQPKYLIFFDFYNNPFCNDINAYLLFEYYIKNNETNAYYVINIQSELYQILLNKNQTNNLIPIHTHDNLYEKIYPYLLNSKILVNSFIYMDIQKIVSRVNYLKYLFITHAIGYFKTNVISVQFNNLRKDKRNIIISSPFEYEKYKNQLKYSDSYMYKAGLPRYDRLNSIQRNVSENKCILISFTYRKYNNDVYQKSLFKKNLETLLNDTSLISFFKSQNIDIIYIQHHYDFLRKRPFNQSNFQFIKYRNQSFLSHYIEQCSLLITDFSTICFDFMFLNKPVLFYLIDIKDKINFEEKVYMKNDNNNNIYFGNVFSDLKPLIKKIQNYTINDFNIENELKKKYESMFYYKTNITERIVQIINNITNIN
jgi:CDP-glycerol glycerophosphotransferase (TagB/SpsB family)